VGLVAENVLNAKVRGEHGNCGSVQHAIFAGPSKARGQPLRGKYLAAAQMLSKCQRARTLAHANQSSPGQGTSSWQPVNPPRQSGLQRVAGMQELVSIR
jgi:hypothetical protein